MTSETTIVAIETSRVPAVLIINGVLRATLEQPFLTENGTWLTAQELTEGMRLADAAVETLHQEPGYEEAFDLEVADEYHTYVAQGFVLHNKAMRRRLRPDRSQP